MGALKTCHIRPPIPIRQFDWHAYLEGQEEAGPNGYGATEAEAIADLEAQLEDAPIEDEDAANCRLVMTFALQAMGAALRQGWTPAVRTRMRSAYRLCGAQLGVEHD